MKQFQTLSQLAAAKLLTGTPVRVLSPTIIDGQVESKGEGLTLLSGNVFVPKFDDIVTGRKTILLSSEFQGSLTSVINRYIKDSEGNWIADPTGRTSNIFYAGKLWKAVEEVDFIPEGYRVTEAGISSEDTGILEVLTTDASMIQFVEYLVQEDKAPERVVQAKSPELIAHRGFADVNIENTLYALRAARLQGADGVEFDVQTSADGTAYLFHDSTVNGLTNGSGTFTSLTDIYLSDLAYTKAAGTPFEGMGISLFSDVLDAMAQQDGLFYPEIKYGNVSTMVNMVKDKGLSSRCVWQSFRLQDLVDAVEIDPEASYGFLIDSNLANMKTAADSIAELPGKFMLLASKDQILANPSIVDYTKSRGLDIGAWTITNPSEALALHKVGVFRVMSDRNVM